MKSAPFLLFLAGLPFAGLAQSSAPFDSLRQRGELTGARPSGGAPARPRPAARRAAAAADPVQQRLLQTTIDLDQARAEQLPDLYERFIGTTRDERRRWSYADWDGAAAVLTRLNQRYEQVRTGLPLEERLRIRTTQGEFHTLRGTRELKNKRD